MFTDCFQATIVININCYKPSNNCYKYSAILIHLFTAATDRIYQSHAYITLQIPDDRHMRVFGATTLDATQHLDDFLVLNINIPNDLTLWGGFDA